ncbi:phage tail protein [Paenibacillus piscarius]|uniref:phage tail-collar fiber domain-containing protein n=1 Tax=Paenibacillus piscarius TaxID=1089681 RepID=UPI001EE8D2BB|nr:hypothetical protein [Paenibacillus piscarius]
MAVFGGMTLTNKGLVLQGKAQAGAQLNYTRVAVGDGSLSGQSIPALNGLISPKKSLPITRINIIPPNKVTVGTVLRNADVTAGFFWREVGVFAQDPDAGEILYAYANAGATADYIPPGGGSDIIEKAFDCIVVVGTAANITAVIDESLVFAKKSELDALDAAKVDKVSGKGLSANDYTTPEKTKLANIAAGAGGANTATDTVIGTRTISDSTAPSGESGTLTTLLSWLANMIKSITGKSSWRTAPATTLEAAKTHADDTTRHITAAERTAWNAKETTAGAQAKADAVQTNLTAHAGNTTAHITAAERSAWNAKADASQLGRVDLTQTLGPGTSVVTADQNGSELDLVVQGQTLVNPVVNKLGSFSANGQYSALTNETTIKKYQNVDALRVTFTGPTASSATGYQNMHVGNRVDPSKYYVFAIDIQIVDALSARVLFEYGSGGTPPNGTLPGNSITTTGQWQTSFGKASPAELAGRTSFHLHFQVYGAANSNQSAIGTGFRMYEVSKAEYDLVGTTVNATNFNDYYPFVAGKQHVQGVVITKQGKNAASVSVVSMTNTIGGANYSEDKSNNSITVNSGTGAGYNYAATSRIQVIPNTVYTLSAILTNVSGPDLPSLSVRKGSDNGVSNITGLGGVGPKSFSFNSGAETEVILFAYGSVATAAVQTKRYENIQLEIGSVATSFMPAEPQSVVLPVTLGQIGDVRDSVYSAGNDWMYVERVKKGIALDGSLLWNWNKTYTGFKRLAVASFGVDGINDTERVVRYDGKALTHTVLEGDNWNSAELSRLTNLSFASRTLLISVSNSDSGWIDAINPSANAAKALFNGWKAAANNGNAYTSWVSILDGSAPVTNTEAWVAANKVPGWTAWATLDYMLAQAAAPVPVPNAEGSITIHPGGNQISVETGVIQREKVVPKLDSGNYYIISQSSGSYWGKAVLSRPSQKFLAVFKGAENDTRNWIFTPDGLGAINARALPANFDTSADYYVTFIALDKYALTANVTETAATWRTGLGGVVSDVVQSVGELRQDNDRQDFADDYIEAKVDNVRRDLDGKAPLSSPALTGIPSAPTAAVGTKNQQIATTEFVLGQAGSSAPSQDFNSGQVGTSTRYSREDHKHPAVYPDDYKVAADLPSTYPTGNSIFFTPTSESKGWPSTYGTIHTIKGYAGGVSAIQYFYPYNVVAPVKYRLSYYPTDAWTGWVEVENTGRKNVAGGYGGLDSNAKQPRNQAYSQFTGQSQGTVSDFKTVLTPGVYTATSTAANHPETGNYGVLVNYLSTGEAHDNSTNWLFQTFYGTNGKVYTRNKTNAGPFSAWGRVYDSRFTGAGSGLDADLHAGKTLAEVVQGSLSYLGTLAGSSPNFTGSANPPIAALAPGQRLSFKALSSTSGPITLNVNGLGAKSVKKPNGNNPPLVQGGVYTVVYDGQAFILQGEGGEYGTAGAADVLAGKTLGTESGIVAGEIPLRGGENYPGWREATVGIPSGVGRLHLAIPKGAYLTGTQDQGGLVGIYKDDPGFNPAYFRADVNMFGLQGAMPVITDGADPAQGVGLWGDGALAVYPREGYRKGGAGAGEIKVTVAQLASVGIKRYASGSTTAYGSMTTQTESHGTQNFPIVTVSGIAFRPRYVRVWRPTSTYSWGMLSAEILVWCRDNILMPVTWTLYSSANAGIHLNDDGFQLTYNTSAGNELLWEAWE